MIMQKTEKLGTGKKFYLKFHKPIVHHSMKNQRRTEQVKLPYNMINTPFEQRNKQKK